MIIIIVNVIKNTCEKYIVLKKKKRYFSWHAFAKEYNDTLKDEIRFFHNSIY
jgi:hypothetical protein